MGNSGEKNSKTFGDRLPYLILIAAIILHFLVIAGLFALDLPGHNRKNFACDFFSLVQAGMDAFHNAGVYNAYPNHPIIWGPEGFPFVLPPWIAYVLGIPLSFFTPDIAYTVFCILLEAALAGIAIFCWRLGGKGKFGALSATLCFLATPQFMVLKEGQTDTFVALGAAMLLWGLYTGRNAFRNIGLGLLLAIKPLGLFAALPILLKRKTRSVTIILITLFLLLLGIAFTHTVLENPDYSWASLDVFKSSGPPGSAFKYGDSVPPKDYFFQFVRYLVVGRDEPTVKFFAFDIGFMNLLRLMELPWVYFTAVILFGYLYLTWRFRRKDVSYLVAAWLLVPLLVMPAAWETYFLLVLPVIALVAGTRRNLLPFLPGVLMLMPNLTWFIGAAVVSNYPLPAPLFILALTNLLVRNLALGWLALMIWKLIGKSEDKAAS
jgi:hypothetical protein